MSNFSIKQSLLKLKDKNYDKKIDNTIDIIVENLDEGQLVAILMNQGLKLDNDIIRLQFMENVGFRCFNERAYIIGKLPICKNIEQFMNKQYLESFK